MAIVRVNSVPFFRPHVTEPLLPKFVPDLVHVEISDIPLSQMLPGIRLPDLAKRNIWCICTRIRCVLDRYREHLMNALGVIQWLANRFA